MSSYSSHPNASFTACLQLQNDYSDQNGFDQLTLLATFNDETLADELDRRLDGKLMSLMEVIEFVLTETPAYKHIAALNLLEDRSRVKVIDPTGKRRKGSFPKELNKVLKLRFGRETLW